jgi:carbonic anhydrase/acetyltransferase-like protein (isoleucine patch superfamily)
MSPAYSFEGHLPVVHPTAFVHPDSVLIGDVHIEAGCYIGPGASLRGDFGRVDVGPGANIQDCCVLHCFPDRNITVGCNGHVGHGAVLHGCEIGDDALIGMNSVVMDAAVIGAQSFIGANSFVKSGFEVPARHLAAGSPARLIRQLTDQELDWKAQGTRTYQQLTHRCRAGLRLATPVTEAELSEAADQGSTAGPGWQHVTLSQYRSAGDTPAK